MPSAEVILAIGAHPDDIELMCGGTLARKVIEGSVVHILTVADGVSSRYGAEDADHEVRLQQAHSAAHVIGAASNTHLGFPDNQLDIMPLLSIIRSIEREVEKWRPTIVYTHHGADLNIDHRMVSEAVVVACRPASGVKLILFGEVPSATDYQLPYNFVPNWYEDITLTFDKKMDALRCYPDELRPFPHVRSIEAIAALATYRGAMISCHRAEAFSLGRKIS